MTPTEERLSGALADSAAEVMRGSLHPLTISRPRSMRWSRLGGAPRPARFAPVLAACAVVGVIALAAELVTPAGRQVPPSARPEPVRLSSAATLSLISGQPRYALLLGRQLTRDQMTSTQAVVMDTRTGRVTAHIPLPSTASYFDDAIDTGNGTTYFVAFGRNSATASGIMSFVYRLQLGAAGTVVSFAPVPGSGVAEGDITALAATPDGRRIAYTSMPGNSLEPSVVYVLDTSTGQASSWTSSSPGQVEDLSWGADGRQLAFTWFAERPADQPSGPSQGPSGSPPGPGTGIWMLDTAVTGEDLLKASKLVAAQEWAEFTLASGVLSRDGKTLYFAEGSRASDPYPGRIIAVSVPQGQRLGSWTAEPIMGLLGIQNGRNSVVVAENSGIYRLDTKVRSSELSYHLPSSSAWALIW